MTVVQIQILNQTLPSMGALLRQLPNGGVDI
jgi:hypothetical protein